MDGYVVRACDLCEHNLPGIECPYALCAVIGDFVVMPEASIGESLYDARLWFKPRQAKEACVHVV